MKGVLHVVEDDLAEDAPERWASEGVAGLELVLKKQAAFLEYLKRREQ